MLWIIPAFESIPAGPAWCMRPTFTGKTGQQRRRAVIKGA
jgi:hypothetical protein